MSRYWLIALLVFCLELPADERLRIYDLQGKCKIEGQVLGADQLNSEVSVYRSSGATSDAAREAQHALRQVLEFYQRVLDWDSIDNNGSAIHVFANYLNREEGCLGFNAFYKPSFNETFHQIGFLNFSRKPYGTARDLDVVAHEFSHGVFRSTEGLHAPFEKDALNESIADLFGVAFRIWSQLPPGSDLSAASVGLNDFKVGQLFAREFNALARETFPDGVLRNMANPAQRDAFDFYSEGYSRGNDYSEYDVGAISSLAFTLLAVGGQHPRLDNGIRVEGIGLDKTLNVVFYVMRHLRFMDLESFAAMAEKAAEKLYGKYSLESRATHNAFAAVGLFDEVLTAVEQQRQREEAERNERERREREAQEQRETEAREQRERVEAERDERERQQRAPEPVPPQSIPAPPPITAPVSSPVAPLQISGQHFIALLLGVLILLIVVVARASRVRGYQFSPTAVEPAPAASTIPLKKEQQRPRPQLPERPPAEPRVLLWISADGQGCSLSLDEHPQLWGREYPDTPLFHLVSRDQRISRLQCEIWYQPRGRFLYVRNHSSNGTRVNHVQLGQGEKGKVALQLKQSLTLELGRFCLALTVEHFANH